MRLMMVVLLTACGPVSGTSIWTVAVGAGGLPAWRGCQLVKSEPADAVTLNSGDFYDAVRPGRASFTCGDNNVRIDVVRATALTIEGPATIAPGKEFLLALHATADRAELDLGDARVTWSLSGALEGTGQCKEFAGCTNEVHPRVRAASAPGTGIATATFGGMSARYEVTVISPAAARPGQ